MKRFFIILFVLCLSTPCFADWYVINGDTNRAIGISQYEPDAKDLESRNEFAVYVKSVDVDLLDAEYFNGKIRRRVKSQQELNEEQAVQEESDQMAEVYHEMFRQAYIKVKEKNKDKNYNRLDKHIKNKSKLDAEIKAK